MRWDLLEGGRGRKPGSSNRCLPSQLGRTYPNRLFSFTIKGRFAEWSYARMRPRTQECPTFSRERPLTPSSKAQAFSLTPRGNEALIYRESIVQPTRAYLPVRRLLNDKGMNGTAHRIFLTVQAGCAEVCEDTLPRGVVVEILDFDGLTANPVDEMSAWLSEL